MAGDASIPTTPSRPPSTDATAPPPIRHSQRARTLSERARANGQAQEEEANAIIEEDSDQHVTRRKGQNPCSREHPTATSTTAVALALGAVMKKLDELTGSSETRTTKLEKQNEALFQAVQQYEARITELVQVVQHNETKIAKLETQNQTLLDMMKKNANEQVKITQSWAQVAARAPSPPTSSPTPPRSSPSPSQRTDESPQLSVSVINVITISHHLGP